MSLRRKFVVLLATISMVATTMAMTAGRAEAATPSALANELAAASERLAEAAMLPELLPVIPGLEANAAMVLGVHQLFVGDDGAFAGLSSVAGSTDLVSDLDGLDGGGFSVDNVTHSLVGPLHTLTFDVAFARQYEAPITVIEDAVQILGSTVAVDVTLPATTFTVLYDEDTATFTLTDLPTLSVNASLAANFVAGSGVPITFGFADAEATGTFNVNFDVDLSLTDPDGMDHIDASELSIEAIDQLVSLDFPDNGVDDLDVDLTLTADVFGTTFGGTLTIDDADLFGGADAVIDFQPVGANPITLLSNVSADTAITALAQLVSGFGASMIAGDISLPFLQDGVLIPSDLGSDDLADFDQVFEVIQPLMDYVTPRAGGQIVCGLDEGPDPDGPGGADGLPTRSLISLQSGDTIHCRAFTSEDGTVSWAAVSGTTGPVVNDTLADTIGLEPTRNVQFTSDGGDFAVEVTFTPDDGSGPITIVRRPETIQALLTELADAGLIPEVGGLPDFDYDADLEAFTFPISMAVAGPITRDAKINAGNQLVAATGITGLAADATASASYSISDIAAGVTLGLIVTDDPADINPADNGTVEPGPGDRFFLGGTDSLLSVGDVTFDAALDMVGRLGFLEIEASISGALTSPGAEPALNIGLTSPGVTVAGHTEADAILVRDLLSPALIDSITAAIDLRFDGSASISSEVPGVNASGSFDVAWDLDGGSPEITNLSTDFSQTLLPFTSDLSLTQVGPADPADETVLTVDPGVTDLGTVVGLVGSQLVDAGGNVCNVTAVLSSSQLTCSNVSGQDANPIDFTDATSYEVKGNTLAKLVQILEAIDALVVYLEEAVGTEAFSAPIDLIGVSPAELVDQVGELRRMLDEFRGIQDAQIDCGVVGHPTVDIRAIPVSIAEDPSGDIDLTCTAAAAAGDAQDIQWRAVDANAAPGPFVPDATGGSVGPSGTTTPFGLTINKSYDESPDANGDGFISLGSEYTIEVSWSDAGIERQAAFPPRTPQSLQQLNELVVDVLGLPDGVLTFELVDVATDPTLRINLGYGICSDPAPAFDDPTDPCAGLPTAPAPEADLSLDLDGLPFVGLSTTGTLDVRFAALGQFDVGVPLSGGTPVLYGTSGLAARVEVNGTDVSIEANIGPVGAQLGDGSDGGDFAAEADDATTLTSTGAFADAGVGMLVTNTSTGAQCVIAAIADTDNATCGDGWDDGSDFADGDPFRLGGASDLQAALELELQITDSGTDTVIAPGDSIAITSAGVHVTDPATFLGGGAECGRIDEDHMDQVVGDPVDPAERNLTGILCAQLSMAATIGNASVYLGELDVELTGDVANPFRVWVPADLTTRLQDALLDPAFLLQALPGLLEAIEDALRSAADSGIPASVADPLRDGADGIESIIDDVEAFIEPLSDLLAGLSLGGGSGSLEDTLATELENLLGLADGDITVTAMCGAVECTGANDLLDLTDISVSFTLERSVDAAAAINLGLEGLPLSVEGGVSAFAGLGFTIGLGVSRDDGPYIALAADSAPEFAVEAGVTLDDGATGCTAALTSDAVDLSGDYTVDRCLRATLGFLQVEAIDSSVDRSYVAAKVALNVSSEGSDPDKLTMSDLLGGKVDLAVEVAANINLDLHLRTGIANTSADLPSIVGTFGLEWGVGDLGDIDDPSDDLLIPLEDLTLNSLVVRFDNLHLDLGSFLSEFIGPIAREIKNITGPLQPIIDVVTAPIPVVSDLAELVGGDPITMLTILAAVSGSDLSLIEAVAAFITFINNIPTDSTVLIPLGGFGGGGARDVGGFNINTALAGERPSPTDAGKLIDTDPSTYAGGSDFTQDVGSAEGGALGNLPAPANNERPETFGVPGLSFPFLEDASQLFGILVGQDAVLIRWDAGTLEAKAGLSYDFGPIMVGPVPITITIGGEIGIRGRFAIGYDTSGIRKLLDGGSGVALFDGIFIDDLDVNGNDVPEITFFGRVFAGASVDLVIVSAGVRGGIELTFILDLDDRPDPDGKLRIEEIVDKLANPICLFEVGGKIEAFLEVFVKIDLFLFSKEFSFELVRITLLEWSSACEPPKPDIASQAGGVVKLHIGELRHTRNIQEDRIDEKIEVRQIGDGKVRVTAFGFSETFDGVTLVIADGGIGADEIIFLAGSDEESADPDDDPLPFDIPVAVSGGPGNDIIKTGSQPDLVYGDAALPGSWNGINFTAPPVETGDPDENADGADVINAGAGNDLIKTQGGNDRVEGEAGRDTIEGGDGDDQLNGGPGGDTVLGQGGDDTVHGGPIEKPAPGASNADIDDDDALSGGQGIDTVSGDFGNDLAFGDDPQGTLLDAAVDGRRLGYLGTVSTTDWRTWCASGSGDTDIVVGNDGDDVLLGGGGIDQVAGDAGNDRVCGGPGDDEVLGNDGDDEVRGDGGNDTLSGNDDDDLVFGGSGNDIAHGDDGDDDVFGDTGSDLLFGDAGDDVVVGDEGSSVDLTVDGVTDDGTTISAARVLAVDTNTVRQSVSSGPARADCDPANATGQSDCVYGGSGSDALFGGSDGDLMFGEAGVDLIEGNDGDDQIRGGTNNDLLLGSADADRLFGDGGDDGLYGDRSIVAWSTDTPQGAGADELFGGPGDDHLEGDGDTDKIFGGADHDHAEGNNGADELRGESGDDDLIGGSDTTAEPDVGDPVLLGGLGSDVIAGDNAVIVNDGTGYVGGRTVTLLDPTIGGPDTIEGNEATDYLFGQFDADTISGGQASDYIEGNGGDDTLAGDGGDDDIIGGSSAQAGDPIEPGRDGTGMADAGEPSVAGGSGNDWIAGDNARMDRVLLGLAGNLVLATTPIKLFDLQLAGGLPVPGTAHGGDAISGDGGRDLIFGQGSDDDLAGGDDPDYIEGNDGDDTIDGGSGIDDLVGGGSAADGLITYTRSGVGLADGGETLISGDTGDDWIAGDNARMNRVLKEVSGPIALPTNPIVLFDLATVSGAPVPAATHGPDTISGGDDTDFVFGQGSGDTIHGDADPDYLEGNDGDDTMFGDGGDDDMVGGGSARDGVVVIDRIGEGLLDVGETLMSGGLGEDWMAGDNAFMNRVLFGDVSEPIDLFDVDSPSLADVSGGDIMNGDEGDDLIFGQGNGSQAGQSDPADGLDNDGDGDVDEDVPWLGDVITAGSGDDYAEGNHGSDLIFGNDGDDDLIGGNSAFDGRIVPERVGDTLTDDQDTVHGGDGEDVVAGDNARVTSTGPLTGLLLTGDREVLLFDVDSGDTAVSGGDFLTGGTERDLVFGQGNGDQSSAQADPLDGVDNDLDGREGPLSSEYDCADNGFDNDGDTFADGADLTCQLAIDEDQPWSGDVILGNEGDDYLEGNAGADWMFGGDDEDDMVGGGSAVDGQIVPDRDPIGLLDGPDVMHGEAEDDVMTGDNARINRVADAGAWARISSAGVASEPGFGPYDQTIRITHMFDGDAGADSHADDYMTGGFGNDEMYGQLGDDFVRGDAGDDGLVGDIGQVTADVLGDGQGKDPAREEIASASPHWSGTVNHVGSLRWETELFAFDSSDGGVGGDDILLGYDGRDTVFGGPGGDIINGDGDAEIEIPDPDQPEFTQMVDPDPTTIDDDNLLGGDGDDAIWGGRQNDVLMGGHQEDHLDVRPREESDNGRNGAKFRIIPRDRPLWHTVAMPESFQGVDFVYGGWDRDALQADQAANGPDPGDRLADWTGGYNVFYVCPAGYGDYSIARYGQPQALEFLRALTQSAGAFETSTDGTSGFRDLAYVFNNERGQNSNPPHPDHPGHFTCADLDGDGTPDAEPPANGGGKVK